MHENITALLIELGAVILALGILGRIAGRLGFSPIPLYLLAGLAFGHGGLLPLAASEEFVATGAEIGVILLLLLLGLEYTASDLVSTLKTQYVSGRGRLRAERVARCRRRAAARLGAGRRGRAGRRHLDLLVRRHREGARRPRPARQPRNPGGAGDSGPRGSVDGRLPADPDRAARRGRAGRRQHDAADLARHGQRRPVRRAALRPGDQPGGLVGQPGDAAARRPRADAAGRRASRSNCRCRRRSARSWSASRCRARSRTARATCSARCGTCSPRSSSSSSA